MSYAVSLKGLAQTLPTTSTSNVKKNASATPAPGTLRPQEIVLRPMPLRRYFE